MITKNNSWCLLTTMMLAILSVSFSACSGSGENEIIPEISVPMGNDNYFTKSMDFDSPAAEKSFTFSTNVAWSLSVAETRNGISWLSVSPTKGEAGTNTVVVKTSDNTTFDDRNAVIMITAGDSVRTVFVNQKQMDALTISADRFEVPVEGGSVSIEVKANIDYVVSIPEDAKDWIHQTNEQTRALTSSTLFFTIDKSEEYDKREGQIVIKAKDKEEIVNIYQVGEGILTLTQNEFNLSCMEQEIAIEINSNFDYGVELPDIDWISEVTTQTRGISTHTLKLAVAKNDDYDGRSAKLRIYDRNSSISEEVVINQTAAGGILILNEKEFNINSSAQELSIEVNSNFEYAVELPDVDWISEVTTQTRGISSHILKLAITKNEDYDSRSAKVRIYDRNSDVSEEVVINQISAGGVLILTQRDFNIGSEAQEISVEISSNFDYAVEFPDVDWIKESTDQTRGISTHILKLAIAKNENYGARSAIIRIYDRNSAISEEVLIKQNGAGPILILSQKEFNISCSTQYISIEIYSNFDYAVEYPDLNWLKESITQTKDASTHILKLFVAKNEDYNGRSAKIRFYDRNSSVSEEVVINQEGEGGILKISQRDFDVDCGAQNLPIEIDSNFDFDVDLSNADWITLWTPSETRGVTSRTLVLHIAKNPTYEDRYADIIIFDRNSDIAEGVTIHQSGSNLLRVEDKEFSFDETGGTFSVKVTSNVSYKVSIADSWVQEITTASTRAVEENVHHFSVSQMTENINYRNTKITFSNVSSGLTEEVVVKQSRLLYIVPSYLDIIRGDQMHLGVINETGKELKWASSNLSVASVDQTGLVSTYEKGVARITVSTIDGSLTSTSVINVLEITDCVSMTRTGSGTMVIGGQGLYYTVRFTIKNKAPEAIHIVSLAGVTSGVAQDLPGGASVSIEIRSQLSLIQAVKQRLVYTFRGREYYIDG